MKKHLSQTSSTLLFPNHSSTNLSIFPPFQTKNFSDEENSNDLSDEEEIDDEEEEIDEDDEDESLLIDESDENHQISVSSN